MFYTRSTLVAIAAAVAMSLSACATNPVTGERQLALISEAQEIELGRESAQQVEAQIGLVPDQGLQSYVSRVGMDLAKTSQRPNLPWKFAVVDDPTPNAFALPGGFIYVTRGMMNLMDSEAELASVIGHEIGHVTARHSVSMISRQQLAQLGLGLGGALFPDLAPAAQAAGAGLQLLFLRYGRDAERQADELGFNYAHGRGYDMNEMADVFTALGRASELENQSPLPTWLASHPAPAERVEAVRARVAALPGDGSGRVNKAEYLNEIDGLVFGVNPRNGFFRENVFFHPDLRFRMTMPRGWEYGNFAQAVVAGSTDNRAMLQLTLVEGSSASQAAQRFLSQQGIQSSGATQRTVNGVPGVFAEFAANTEGGAVRGGAAFYQHQGRVYQVLGYAASSAFPSYQAALAETLGSFAPVSDPEVLNVQPQRIDIVRINQAQTLARFNQSQPSTIPIETLALVNQVPQPTTTLASGTLVKRVVR